MVGNTQLKRGDLFVQILRKIEIVEIFKSLKHQYYVFFAEVEIFHRNTTFQKDCTTRTDGAKCNGAENDD